LKEELISPGGHMLPRQSMTLLFETEQYSFMNFRTADDTTQINDSVVHSRDMVNGQTHASCYLEQGYRRTGTLADSFDLPY
jgi:hypothetical protein